MRLSHFSLPKLSSSQSYTLLKLILAANVVVALALGIGVFTIQYVMTDYSYYAGDQLETVNDTEVAAALIQQPDDTRLNPDRPLSHVASDNLSDVDKTLAAIDASTPADPASNEPTSNEPVSSDLFVDTVPSPLDEISARTVAGVKIIFDTNSALNERQQLAALREALTRDLASQSVAESLPLPSEPSATTSIDSKQTPASSSPESMAIASENKDFSTLSSLASASQKTQAELELMALTATQPSANPQLTTAVSDTEAKNSADTNQHPLLVDSTDLDSHEIRLPQQVADTELPTPMLAATGNVDATPQPVTPLSGLQEEKLIRSDIDTPSATVLAEATTADTNVNKVEPMAAVVKPNTVIIQDGDSLWDISHRVYGGGYHYQHIVDANPGLRKGKRIILKPGQELLIPSLTASNERADQIAAEPKTVEVREGDSLWKIAKRVYGAGKHHHLLATANSALLADKPRLKAGMILVAPDPDTDQQHALASNQFN